MDSEQPAFEQLFRNLPPIETERLLLRKLRPEDAGDMFDYGRDPEVTKYVMWEAHRTVEDSAEFIRWVLRQYANGQPAPWGIELKAQGKLIGTVGFHEWSSRHGRAELGYSMSRLYWGQGIMTEAARAVLDFGFRVMGLNRIEASCFVGNIASARVLEKCGMDFEGVLAQYMFVKGRYADLKMYSILREKWAADGPRRDGVA